MRVHHSWRVWFAVLALPLMAGCDLITIPVPTLPKPPTTAGQTTPPPASPTTSAPPTVSAPPTTVTLASTGIGSFPFGAPKAAVQAYLTTALGQPDSTGSALGVCEGGAGLWGSGGTWGDLSVQYYADDGSPSSLQHLASWGLRSAGQPKPPLALAPDIPVGLTLQQLQAQYPDGVAMENMGAWWLRSGVVIIPASDTDAGAIFAGLMDWCT